MPLRHLHAARYITPLREGGSLPGLVEAEDGGQYVVKWRGAGQGVLPLASEIIVGEMARTLGLPVPEIAVLEIDAKFGKSEADTEIRELLKASVGKNVALRFLPGATTFDPAAGDTVGEDVASLIVWLDAFSMNVDRTARNANLLLHDGQLALIDHGAALYLQHDWPTMQQKSASAFPMIEDHILLKQAGSLEVAGVAARAQLTPQELKRLVHLVPDEMLTTGFDTVTAEARREGYLAFFQKRLLHSSHFEAEVVRARKERL